MAYSTALYMLIFSMLPKVDCDNVSTSFIAFFVQSISNFFLCIIHKLYEAMHVATKLEVKHNGTFILLKKYVIFLAKFQKSFLQAYLYYIE